MNGDIRISFSNLKILKTDKDYHEGALTILLNNGDLNINPYRFDFLNGNVSGDLELNASVQPTFISLNLKGLDLMISDLKDVSSHLRNATANLLVNVQSKGDTVKSLMGHLKPKCLLD